MFIDEAHTVLDIFPACCLVFICRKRVYTCGNVSIKFSFFYLCSKFLLLFFCKSKSSRFRFLFSSFFSPSLLDSFPGNFCIHCTVRSSFLLVLGLLFVVLSASSSSCSLCCFILFSQLASLLFSATSCEGVVVVSLSVVMMFLFSGPPCLLLPL